MNQSWRVKDPTSGEVTLAGVVVAVLNGTLVTVGIGLALTCGILFVVRWRSMRRQAPVGSYPANSKASPEPCSDPGCQEQTGRPCTYRDESGRRCGTIWCHNHIKLIGASTYCRRHFALVKALDQTEGSIFQVKRQPPLEDRALSLLDLIRRNVDPVLGKLLADAAAGHPGVEVAAQKSVHEVQDDGQLIAWQISWGLHNNRGYLLKVSIRVGVPEPPVVQAIVGNDLVFEGVPYWIRRRLVGEPPLASDQPAFFADLIQAVEEATGHALPGVRSQLDYESEKFGPTTTTRRY